MIFLIPVLFPIVTFSKDIFLFYGIAFILKGLVEMAEHLEVNRTFLSGYLRALEDQGFIKSKKIGPAKVYFNKETNKGA